MPKQQPQTFGEIALSKGFITPDDFKLCVEIQIGEELAGVDNRKLGEILCARGHLTQGQVNEILEEQARASGRARVGPFEALSRLGEGGMGRVYKARNLETGEEVALKVLSRKLSRDIELLERFRREADAILALDHPNIIKAHTFGEERGRYYIAMEYLPGGDLRAKLRERGSLTEKESLEIIRDVAMGLQHAHGKGMVHRDIKPSNILFTEDGRVKLGDFGVVKQLDSGEAPQLTLVGTTVGTPHYISPEQARGDRESDIRADIYSLGAMLYHLLTGRTPFEGPSALVVMQKHLTEKLTPPDEIIPSVTDGCVAVLERMMAKDRADRYIDPAELIHDVDRVLQGFAPECASVAPEKTMVQVSRRRRRRAAKSSKSSRTLKSVTVRGSRSSARGRRWASLRAPKSKARPMLLILGGVVSAAAVAVWVYYPTEPVPAPAPKPPVVERAPVPDPPPPPPAAKPPARVSREERARKGLDAVLRFEGIQPGDTAAKIERLEKFIKEHPDTFAAARAAGMIKSLAPPPEPDE